MAEAESNYKVLYAFREMRGSGPDAGLIADSAGNLYGTTEGGGRYHYGTVYQLTPPLTGETAWKETVLHSFNSTRGSFPLANLLMDGAGNLFGTTYGGGAHGYGVVFKLSPPVMGKRAWTEEVLYSFNSVDGQLPLAGLTADAAGNLYGTTASGGGQGGDLYGDVFELSPPTQGTRAWKHTVLFSFNQSDGQGPEGSLIVDGAGNLYGTTAAAGPKFFGNVFELSPPKVGKTAWTETVLLAFNGTNGLQSQAGLLADSGGNLYGTTEYGGATYGSGPNGNGYGAVFELSPPTGNKKAWTETVLFSFNGTNGERPRSTLIADRAGNLYGTTTAGGAHGDGVAFELAPPTGGGALWTEGVLHSFNGAKGSVPYAGLISDGAGNLYGTALTGGAHSVGVAFRLTP